MTYGKAKNLEHGRFIRRKQKVNITLFILNVTIQGDKFELAL